MVRFNTSEKRTFREGVDQEGDGKHRTSEEGAVVRKLCGGVRLSIQSCLGQKGQRKLSGDREEQGTSRGGTQTDTYSHFQVHWL